MKKKILIVAGDPESINSEIIFKSWKQLSKTQKKRIFVIANFELLTKQFKRLDYKIKTQKVKNIYSNSNSYNLKIINIDLKFKNPFNINRQSLKKYISKSFDLAHKNGLNLKKVSGIINCPINKTHLNLNNQGITEYLAKKCKVKKNSEVMLIKNKNLAVTPITTHINIRDISKKIKRNLIMIKLKSLNTNYKKYFNKKPKIAILGLNPHNAELKKNSEENKVIIPVIKKLKKIGLKVSGPFPADTIFISDHQKYDVIVGMYHDQVLGPFKALYKFYAVNLTLGLPYLRVSPDHGVGLDIVGKNKANEQSLLECIKFLTKFS